MTDRGSNGPRGARRPSAIILVLGVSCTGEIVDPSLTTTGIPGTAGDPGTGHSPPATDPQGLPGPGLAAASGLRRLTVAEYDATLLDLLGDTRSPGQALPADSRVPPRQPFDNDYTTQVVEPTLIAGVEQAASDVAARLLADAGRRDKVVGCVPAGPTDAQCLRRFIATFGRRAWRRTLADEDITRLMQLESAARRDNDFYSAVDAVIHVVLQDPEFLFRIEAGVPVPGVPGLFKLTGPELATRLAYFLWGSMPDDALLALAENGGLETAEQVRARAGEMLARPAAQQRISRFHSLWMGYDVLPSATLAPAMKAETEALMKRVIFDSGKKLPWQELFRSNETYVTGALARYYGITSLPATLQANPKLSAWVPYSGTKRQGLLSHASFLALAATADEKLMTIRRGKAVRELLFCQELPPKPASAKPGAATPRSPCKPDVLDAHRQGSCAGCHAVMDPVGLGLDSYDGAGKYRATEKDLPQCKISGDGELDGKEFNGPAGLADRLLETPDLNRCLAKQLYRFAMGRSAIDATDQQFLDLMAARMGAADFRLDQLLLDFVSSGAFAHRRAEK